jgi:TRAP-type C4-dicarboxylate transport system permease small subunit
LIHLYCRVLDALAAAGLALMVALVFGNVVLRYVFDSGIAVSEELSRWLFIWITFLGAIVALREGGHLGTDLLLARLPPRLRRACGVLAQLLMLGICWLLLQGTLEQTRINWSNTAPSSGFSLAFFYGSGVVFAVSAGLIVLQQLAAALLGHTPPQAATRASGAETA